MAYYIFLKSLRSLEEFKKNPHIKIPPKSPCTNFQSLGKFKNPIFIPKMISLQILAQLAQPSHRPVRPFSPRFLPLTSSSTFRLNRGVPPPPPSRTAMP
jgi:hypothetical protein